MSTEGQQAKAPPAPSQLRPTRPQGTPPPRATAAILRCMRMAEGKNIQREELHACVRNALWSRRVVKLAARCKLPVDVRFHSRVTTSLQPKTVAPPTGPRVNFQPTKSRLSKQVPWVDHAGPLHSKSLPWVIPVTRLSCWPEIGNRGNKGCWWSWYPTKKKQKNKKQQKNTYFYLHF